MALHTAQSSNETVRLQVIISERFAPLRDFRHRHSNLLPPTTPLEYSRVGLHSSTHWELLINMVTRLQTSWVLPKRLLPFERMRKPIRMRSQSRACLQSSRVRNASPSSGLSLRAIDSAISRSSPSGR